MHFSLVWRQHWKPAASAGALVAGFLLSAPAVALTVLAAGMTLLGAVRLCRLQADAARRPREGALGVFGYLEAGPPSFPCEH